MKKNIVLSMLVFILVFFYRCVNNANPATSFSYIGSEKCQSCHQKEFELFKMSDHYHAMDSALPATVKADFNNSRFIYYGDTAFFYMKNGRYCVNTSDTSGTKKEYLVSYTFGWNPLQQYLVRFDDGRLQVLPFCWDTREKEKGGQHWFHLYDKEKITPGDELFWMGINQNWNYLCADCHTTNFKKNFNPGSNIFQSSWDESRVSCESCHGPASAHIQWTVKQNNNFPFKGFVINLASKSMNWKMDVAKQTKIPEAVIKNDTLIETCARCHARATRFSDQYMHGRSLLQTHIPTTIDPENYYIDGQIKEEDYEYGSFLQSKMYAAGVTCTNCHEPHSMKVKVIGNNLCSSCHAPSKYDGPQHSFHKISGTGNQCVNCHMPVTTYMVIDNRLDHSIRIPRLDQSLRTGTPNACNKCHTDKTVQWATSNFTKWYSEKLSKEKTYAELLYNISRFVQESEPSLYELLLSKNYPAIIKATAMEQYSYFTTSRVSSLIFQELKSNDPYMRINSLKALGNYPPETVLAYAAPLLHDQVAGVRMEALVALAAYNEKLSAGDSTQFNKVLNEYIKVQEQLSDRPEGFFNRAIILNYTGNSNGAKQLYLTCITRFPDFFQSYANLIDLYRQQNRDEEAKKIIDMGMMKHPDNPFLHYALGMWHFRKKDNVNGIAELKKAATMGPDNPQVVYGYAIGLFSKGEAPKAIQFLEQFVSNYGNNLMILEGIISICQNLHLTEKSNKYETIRKTVFGY